MDGGGLQAAAKFEDSLSNLQTHYLDLFLLHYSSCWGSLCTEEEKAEAGTWQATWRQLEQLAEAGKIRALGELSSATKAGDGMICNKGPSNTRHLRAFGLLQADQCCTIRHTAC